MNLPHAIQLAIKDRPKDVARCKAGSRLALAYLIGQVTKHTKGEVHPAETRELLIRKIDAL